MRLSTERIPLLIVHTSINMDSIPARAVTSLLLLQSSLSSTVLNILQSHEHCVTIPPSEGHQTYYAITNILVQSHNPALYNHIILTTTYNLNTPFHLNSTPCCHPPRTLHYSFSVYRHPPCQCMQFILVIVNNWPEQLYITE